MKLYSILLCSLCTSVLSMDDASVKSLVQDATQQVASINPDSSADDYIKVMKNCGKLELAIEKNWILPGEEQQKILWGISNIETAFKTKIKTEQKKAVTELLLMMKDSLEALQEK